jgi:hypothetical protein
MAFMETPKKSPHMAGSRKFQTKRIRSWRVKRLYTILTMTALLGWMPMMLCLLIVDFALQNGAREWADLAFNLVFGGLWLTFVVVGAWIHTHLG